MNIDPKDLKSDTLINSEERGWFLKDESGSWLEVFPHCVDCAELVTEEEAREYFGEFEIKAVPKEEVDVLEGMVWFLADAMSWEQGMYTPEVWYENAKKNWHEGLEKKKGYEVD